MNKFFNSLGPFRWTFHNVVAHPFSEIFWLFKLKSIGNWIHDVTVPCDSLDEDTVDAGTVVNSFDEDEN